MALKILQVVGAAAVVIIVLLLIPVLIRLRRALNEVGLMVAETRPRTVTLLRSAQGTLDGVNRELENIEEITDETQVLVSKIGDASKAVERAVKSPLAKAGFVSTGIAAGFIGVKRSLSRNLSKK